MNKTYLKSYYAGIGKNNNYRKRLENKCFKYENIYLISDSYSIIVLNDSYNMDIVNDDIKDSMIKFYKGFMENYNFKNDIVLNDEEFTKIDDKYTVNNKIAKKIIKIIKADKISILERKEVNKFTSDNPIIYLENTDTKEKAYLLPCRTY